MRRLRTTLAIAVILTTPVMVLAQSVPYGWTISSSDQDPLQNAGSIAGITAYLWYFCAGPPPDGMSAAEFDLETSLPAVHLATIPQNGFLNAGGITNLLLAVGGCPTGPMVAAHLIIAGSPTPTVAIRPSAANGNKVTVDCSTDPTVWPFDWIGFNDPGKGELLCGVIGHCPVLLCNDGMCYDIDCWPDCDCHFPNEVGSCDECIQVSVEVRTWGETKASYR